MNNILIKPWAPIAYERGRFASAGWYWYCRQCHNRGMPWQSWDDAATYGIAHEDKRHYPNKVF